MKTNTKTSLRGMTLVEITVVIFVLLVLISALFIGANISKKKADHSAIKEHIEKERNFTIIASRDFCLKDSTGAWHKIEAGDKLSITYVKVAEDNTLTKIEPDLVMVNMSYKINPVALTENDAIGLFSLPLEEAQQ